jgi:hypothetical protein
MMGRALVRERGPAPAFFFKLFVSHLGYEFRQIYETYIIMIIS